MQSRVTAKSLEQHVVALGAVLDAPQEAHRGVTPEVVVEVHGVQIFHGDPPENRSRFLNVGAALAD